MNRDEMIKFIVDCVAQTYRADAAGISPRSSEQNPCREFPYAH